MLKPYIGIMTPLIKDEFLDGHENDPYDISTGCLPSSIA